MIDLKIINPASGSIIMALGIFLYGAIEGFPYLNQVFGELFTIVLVIIGMVIYTVLTRQFFHKHFLVPFLNNPVNSFVMGSWIAGVSVLCNVVTKYFPEISRVVQVTAIINTVFWVLFILYCVYNFKQLWKRPSRHSIHGVILLSTVATQSLVIVWVELFPFISDIVVISAISLGLLFYLGGILLIGFRYISEKQWSLSEDWTNTNCIIHGALSITGLAIVASQLASALFIMIFWLIVFILLIIVETLEVMRAIKRVSKLGWKKGILTYNISQWSRNFTFGMFYAFTMMMHENPYYMNSMYHFHEGFLTLWAWIVLVTLIGEIGLWIESKWHFFERAKGESIV
ncbi:TDT family transporter [Virgibacillus ainsalahensis]